MGSETSRLRVALAAKEAQIARLERRHRVLDENGRVGARIAHLLRAKREREEVLFDEVHLLERLRAKVRGLAALELQRAREEVRRRRRRVIESPGFWFLALVWSAWSLLALSLPQQLWVAATLGLAVAFPSGDVECHGTAAALEASLEAAEKELSEEGRVSRGLDFMVHTPCGTSTGRVHLYFPCCLILFMNL